ncbi:hypothetical protein [Egicoccus sp. AB-alg2]|uniref:hypothetical protein n=1 Tax=Egicoccus sp. AB-alg2 TaxID=3242693 RepID=UPI00359E8E58
MGEPRRPDGRLRRVRCRREHGGVSGEYVGVLVVIGALVGTLTLAPFAPYVADWARYAVCSLFGDDCDAPQARPAAPEFAPVSMVCLEASDREGVGGNVTVFSAKVSSDLSYQIDRTSDGRHEVTLELSGGLAGKLATGGSLSADALGVRQGREGAVELGADVTVAPAFSFSSREAAVAFAEQARDLVAGPVDDLWDWRTLIPVYGPGRIPVNQYQRIRDFQAPPPSGLRVQGEITTTASGDLYGNAYGAAGVLSAGQSLGADFDFETGETTYYVALDASVAAELQLGPSTVPVGGGVSGSGELAGDVTVALTVDAAGHPTTLAFGAAAAGYAGLDLGLEGLLLPASPFTAIGPDLDSAVAALELDARTERSLGLSATATLDLTQPGVRELGTDVLAAIATRDRVALATAGTRLADHLVREAPLEAQLHRGSRDQFDLGASGGKGLAFGFGLSHEESSLQLAGAWMRPAGGHFQRGYCS